MTLEQIETGLRHIFRDTDGRLYAPVTGEHGRPYVYLPGHSLHYNGLEVHQVLVTLDHHGDVRELDMLCDNGYTLDKSDPVIARLIEQLA